MLKKTILSLIILVIIVFAGCNKTDSPVSPTQSDVLIPLKVGNTWIYQGGSKDSVSTDTLKVIRDTIINGVTWYFFNSDSSDVVTNLNDGFYDMFIGSYSYMGSGLSFKYPAKVGDTCSSSNNNSTQNGIRTVLSVNESITVKAGTFKCYKFQSYGVVTDTTYNFSIYTKDTVWICPNIGMIKTKSWVSFDNIYYNYASNGELQSFNLK
ncbi:MAG: hypothetical protein ABSG15_02855 [FCB group bacterium]|jgi:hypothetical protein